MSFAVKVKEELLAQSLKDKYQLAAIIKLSGSLEISQAGLALYVTTENAKIARYIYELFLEIYQAKTEIHHQLRKNLRKTRVYTVYLSDKVEEILSDLHLADSFFGIETGIGPVILDDEEASRSYLRGAFLATGTMKDPEKGRYQLEMSSVYQDHAEDLARLMQKFLLSAKTIERKNASITYIQKAEDIMDFLIVVGAMQARDEFESIKILRETRNELNRANNAETANIARTVQASVKTIHNISKIMDKIGIEELPDDLQEVARLRIQHPDYSIQQLADCLMPPLSKSGVNHRLRKINKIADEL